MDAELHNRYYFRHHYKNSTYFGDAILKQDPVTSKIIADENY
jgi:hypothetical protein